jgi:hypothetical protein
LQNIPARAEKFGAFYFVWVANNTPKKNILFLYLNFLANSFQFYVSFPDVVSLGAGNEIRGNRRVLVSGIRGRIY